GRRGFLYVDLLPGRRADIELPAARADLNVALTAALRFRAAARRECDGLGVRELDPVVRLRWQRVEHFEAVVFGRGELRARASRRGLRLRGDFGRGFGPGRGRRVFVDFELQPIFLAELDHVRELEARGP